MLQPMICQTSIYTNVEKHIVVTNDNISVTLSFDKLSRLKSSTKCPHLCHKSPGYMLLSINKHNWENRFVGFSGFLIFFTNKCLSVVYLFFNAFE